MTFNKEQDHEDYTVEPHKKYEYSVYSFEEGPVIHPTKNEKILENLDQISVYSKLETASYKSKKSVWSVPFSYYFRKKNQDGETISPEEEESYPKDTLVKSWQITVSKNKGTYKWRFQKSVKKY